MVDAHFRAHQQRSFVFQLLQIERKSIEGHDEAARLGGIAFEFVRPLPNPPNWQPPLPIPIRRQVTEPLATRLDRAVLATAAFNLLG
jgi:hypothetical protein